MAWRNAAAGKEGRSKNREGRIRDAELGFGGQCEGEGRAPVSQLQGGSSAGDRKEHTV